MEIYADIKIFNLDMTRKEKIRLKVDTGAIYTSIPRKILEKIGIKPIARKKLYNFDGTCIERNIGVAIIEYKEHRAGITVVFGEENDAKILGITALEELGLKINPITGKLEPYMPRQ